MAENSHFMGQDGFHWFVGVVEDRNDPSTLGRVRDLHTSISTRYFLRMRAVGYVQLERWTSPSSPLVGLIVRWGISSPLDSSMEHCRIHQ